MMSRWHHRSLLNLFLFFGLPYSRVRAMATADSSNSHYRLFERLSGFKDRKNDLVIFRNTEQTLPQGIVYYFGGDIQDLPERMKASRGNAQYLRWNLVATGEILCRRFPNHSIVVVRPNQMKDGTFSRFSNFVPKTIEYGDPISYDTTNLIGLHHLRALDEQLNSSSSQLALIGFSKGCIVLNQLLHELTALRPMTTEDDLRTFASRIRTFIWLDGGHANGGQAMIWPKDENLVSTLGFFGIRTEIFVTPYQINRSSPHKRHHVQQYDQFSQLLRCQSSNENDTNIKNEMVFADEPPSIEKHFELLTVF